jgi:NADPH-dependent ferric siderophore reductase
MNRPIAERVRHELKFRVATVTLSERITPGMARITLTHPSFSEFPSASYDDHMKLFFAPVGSEPVMPAFGPNGPEWPEGAVKPEARDYTPRSFDKATAEIVIDFVLHGDGPAASWAAVAKPGDTVGVGGPRGSFVVRNDLDYYVLIGDETALPAIGRRIEELPAATPVIALLEVADPAERQVFQSRAKAEITWLPRSAGGPSLLDAAKTLTLPPGTGYIFIAGEAATSAAIREHFVTGRGYPAEQIKAASYWRRGDADFDDGHAH